MLLKLAALGAAGYAGYRYLKSSRAQDQAERDSNLVAGGPLSRQAKVQAVPSVPQGGPASVAYGVN